MKSTEENIKELKKLIRIELADCKEEVWPKVCAMQKTPKGYARLEEWIIRYVAKEAMPIGAAIAHLEQELTHQQ